MIIEKQVMKDFLKARGVNIPRGRLSDEKLAALYKVEMDKPVVEIKEHVFTPEEQEEENNLVLPQEVKAEIITPVEILEDDSTIPPDDSFTRVEMIMTIKTGRDGLGLETYKKGEVHVFDNDIADLFKSNGWAI